MTHYCTRCKGRVNSVPFTYTVTSAPASYPITLDEVKDYLRLDAGDTSEDALLNLLIETASDYFVEYTGVYLINTGFKTFRDCFCYDFSLKKSRLQSVTAVNYYNSDNVLTLIPNTVYANTFEYFYSKVYVLDNQSWPTDLGRPLQGIEIDFIVGFGDDASLVPSKIKLALLQHIAMMYANRGDCISAGNCGCSTYLPATAKAIYNLFRIRDFTVKGECSYGRLFAP